MSADLARREGRRSFLAGLGVVVLPACASPRREGRKPPAAVVGKPYRLVQDWTFGDTIRDLGALRQAFHTRYVYADGTLDTLNDEWQRYRDNDNHEFVEGALALVARAPYGLVDGKVESGMLRSKWHGRYGYFEARLRIPTGLGMWPAFWLNPQDAVWPPEIDILEVVNNGRDTTRHSFHFVHGGDRQTNRTTSSLLDRHHRYSPGFDYAEGFHDFAVLWEPGRVRHYVDDLLVVDRRFDWVHSDGRDAGTAHVLLNLAVGGKWPGPPMSMNDFPARLLIQHVRVWQF